jgi:hypothetical protein
MKIIDEKGRLFGKINIIDFLVILFLISLTPMFYFGYKIFTKKTSVKTEEPKIYTEMEINGKFTKVGPDTLKLITVGDKELDETGKVIGEITSIEEVNPYIYNFNIGSEKTITKEDPALKEIFLRLKLIAEVKDNNLYYKDKQIFLNSLLNFKTNKYTVDFIPAKGKGYIANLEEIKEIKIDLYIILKSLTKDMLQLISVGDREVGEDKEVVAEILNIDKIEDNFYEINLSEGSFTIGEDGSGKKQVFVKMRLKCLIDEAGQLYFKNNRITDKSILEFKTDKYTVFGKIATTQGLISPVLKKQWVQAVIKFSGIISEVAKIVYEGDKETDAGGQTVAILKKIISNKSSEVLVLKEDKWITLEHPFQKDIIAVLNIICVEEKGSLYFKNIPARIGNPITFSTDLYSISGVIVSMQR